MDNVVLKQAALRALNTELDLLPSEDELKAHYSFTPEFKKKINDLIAKTDRRYVSVAGFKLRRAVVALVAALLMLTGCMSFKAVREPIVKFFAQTYEKGTDITFEGTEYMNPDDFEYKMPVPPEGYFIVEEEKYGGLYDVKFKNINGDIIYYTQLNPDGATVMLNTENADVSYIDINGHEAMKIENGYAGNIIAWCDGIYYYEFIGTCDMGTLEKTAKTIK